MNTRKRLPGTTSSPLHFALLASRAMGRLPPWAVALALLGMAGATGGVLVLAGWPPNDAASASAVTLLAAGADWSLLHSLPRAGRSYGPATPTLLMLFALRCAATVGAGLTVAAFLPAPIAAATVLLVQLAGVGLALHGFWIEPHRLTVSTITLATPKLPKGKALRILHLADLHVERLTARDERVIEAAHRLGPDIILFSGDLLNISHHYDPVSHAGVVSFFDRLPRPPLGIFAVSGSPAVDLPDETPLLYARMPHVRWLRDECVSLSHEDEVVHVLGMDCTHDPDVDAPKLAQLSHQGGSYTILLYHSPDLAPYAADHRIDLQLSGHTHGGQVRLPFYGAIVTGLIGSRKLQMGLIRLKETWLYVSRGIGMEGLGAPRVRFLCPPEIALIEVRGSD